MLNKCACGRYTDFGSTCISCSMQGDGAGIELDFDVQDFVEEEVKETESSSSPLH
jgi:hypothetical protein